MIIRSGLRPSCRAVRRSWPSERPCTSIRSFTAARQQRAGARDYKSAVEALNGLQSNLSVVDAIGKSGRSMNDLAIPEMQAWCRRAGYESTDLDRLNPIHVAGTKGKGSTSAFVSSILSQCASSSSAVIPKTIGLYTSPHLRHVQERIQINNSPISEALFAQYFFELWDRLESSVRLEPLAAYSPSKPGYFRYLTLMAFHAFLSSGVDTAVIECGIGGEYDSTNILTAPTVCAVTSLGIDHTALLGDSIEDIAWHKAGIFKRGSRAREVYTVSTQPAAALKVLRRRANDVGLTLRVVDRHSALLPSSPKPVDLGSAADFQRTNASLAIAVAGAHLRVLGVVKLPSGHAVPLPEGDGFALPPEFKSGLEAARWSGRCEIRREGKVVWHLDGGHTIDSVRLAGEWFAQSVTTSPSGTGPKRRRRVLVFNQATRDAVGLVKALHASLRETMFGTDAGGDAPLFDHALFCTNTPFAEPGAEASVADLEVQSRLAEAWAELDRGSIVGVENTVEDAVRAVGHLQSTDGGEIDVLVTGSLHLVGGVLQVLDQKRS